VSGEFYLKVNKLKSIAIPLGRESSCTNPELSTPIHK